MNREAIAWAAGLFEGEGSISCVHSQNRHRLQGTILMADEDRLALFAETVGLGRVIPYAPPSHPKHHRPLFRWYISGHEKAQALMAMLWPWLGPRRRGQFLSTIACYRANTPGKLIEYPSDEARRTADQRRERFRVRNLWHRTPRPGTGQEAML